MDAVHQLAASGYAAWSAGGEPGLDAAVHTAAKQTELPIEQLEAAAAAMEAVPAGRCIVSHVKARFLRAVIAARA